MSIFFTFEILSSFYFRWYAYCLFCDSSLPFEILNKVLLFLFFFKFKSRFCLNKNLNISSLFANVHVCMRAVYEKGTYKKLDSFTLIFVISIYAAREMWKWWPLSMSSFFSHFFFVLCIYIKREAIYSKYDKDNIKKKVYMKLPRVKCVCWMCILIRSLK